MMGRVLSPAFGMSSAVQGIFMRVVPLCVRSGGNRRVFPGTDSRRWSPKDLRTRKSGNPIRITIHEKDTNYGEALRMQIDPATALHRLCYKRAAVEQGLKWGAKPFRASEDVEESGSGPANLAGVPVAVRVNEDASRLPSLLAATGVAALQS